MIGLLHRLWEVTKYTGKQYVEDQCSRTAAALAYSTLLAMVPLMLVSLSIASAFPQFDHTTQALQNFILENFVSGSAGQLQVYIKQFIHQLNRLSWTNIVAFSFTALLLLYNMVEAFNRIWGVKMRIRFALKFFIYFIVLLAMPLLFGLLMILISYVGSISFFGDAGFHRFVGHPAILVLPYVATFVVFAIFNWVLPSCKVKIRFALTAGLVSMLLFELMRYGFTTYIKLFPTYQLIYGARAIIPIFFVWVYLSWIIILFGAILCKGLQDKFFPVNHQVTV